MPSARPRPSTVALAGMRLLVPALLALAFVLLPQVAQATTITVTGGCTLVDAIDSANHDTPFSTCPGGSGADLIVLTAPLNLVPHTYDTDGPNATGSITGTIVISGGVAGAIVERTGADDARLFHIAATGNLTLVNVTVKNGRLTANDGGAIYNRGTLTLLNSVIFSNTAATNGGGIFNDIDATAILTGSALISNSAPYGGAFYNVFGSTAILSGSQILSNTALGEGGGFYNYSTVTLTGSMILSNTATNGGGFFSGGDSTTTLTNTQILSNTATNYGGGFFSDTTTTTSLTGSKVSSNTTLTGNGGGFANLGTATLMNTQIVSNTALNANGGGFLNDGGTTTLTNTQILSNTATYYGGGFFNSMNATVSLTGSQVSANTAQTRGGGFFNMGIAILTNSTLRFNRAQFSDGGGFINSVGATTLMNTEIVSNTAINLGGGFYNQDGAVILTDTQILSNTTLTGNGGGFANSGTATLTNTQILSNTALTGNGGGFFNAGSATAKLTGSSISSNTAQAGGGFYNDENGSATLTDVELVANRATDGAGFYNLGTARLTDAEVIANAAQKGGGFYNDSTATLTNTLLLSNTATNFGGGFVNDVNGAATLTDIGVRANQATNEGGGFSNSGTTTWTGGELVANTGKKGGGFYNIGTVTVAQVRILANTATNAGGAIYQDFFGATTVNQSCLVNNSDTAVVHNNGPTLDAENNWWGAPDGPSGAGLGSGDSVSSGVDFTPFHTTTLLGCPLLPAEIAFDKRISPAGTLMPGQPVTYTLTLTNTGALTVHNLYISDALPLGFVLDTSAATGAPFRMSGNTTIFTSTAPGQVATVTISGHVDAALNHDALLTNTGSVSNPVLALLTDSVAANVVVPTLQWSSAAYQSAEGSGAFSATVELAPANPYAAATVQAFITDSADLFSATSVQTLTIPAGSSSQTLVVEDIDDQKLVTRTVQLVLGAAVGAAVGTPNEAILTFVDNDEVGLSVDASANVAAAHVGETITYTVRITNTGNVAFATIAANASLSGALASLAGGLAPGATRSAAVPYVVQPGDVGALVNTVTVTGTDALGAMVVAEDSVTVTVTPKPKLLLPVVKR